MKHMMDAVEAVDATSSDYLMLSKDVSPWKAVHYLSVTRPIPGSKIVSLSGRYLAKVFEGPYSNMRQWYKELIAYVKERGEAPDQVYFNYTMCPRCAKAYGKNYVVGFVKLK